MNFLKNTYFILLLFFLCHSQVYAERINIAVASNFIQPMKDIVAEYEKVSTHQVNLSFGSSGKLYAQIKHGAPYHAFFSADQTKPEILIQNKLAEGTSRFTYAMGRLVLWSKNTALAVNEERILSKSTVSKLALANDKLAPYGRAAVEVLTHLKQLKQSKNRWVIGENIGQTFQFVDTKNADLGFISLSQIMKNGVISNGSVWLIPPEYYQPIYQDAVILTKGKQSQAVQAFFLFIKSKKVIEIMASYGYQTLDPHS